MPDTPTDEQVWTELNRLSDVLTQSGTLHTTVNEPAGEESPELYYSYGGKDFLLVLQPL